METTSCFVFLSKYVIEIEICAMKLQWIILGLACMAISSCSALEILGIVLVPAQSHYFVGAALMKGLAKAGHKVTFVNPLPPKTPVIENLEEVEITGTFDLLGKTMTNFFDMADRNPIAEMTNLYDMGIMLTNHTLNNQNVRNLMNSGRHFDVVIVEIFVSEALIGLGRHFNAPVIGFSTFGASIWTTNLIGNPSPLSFVPHPFLSFTHNMDFWQRVGNTLMTTFETTFMELFYYPRQEALYKHAFPNTNRSLKDVLKNDVSLVLVNTHFSLGFPRPYLPNMVEVGGMHINRKTAVLPEDLKTILDNAKNGVVYFSMGSNLKSAQLPLEKRNGLINAFRKRKELILWKWEDENLPGKPENVIIRKWFPQDAVLAHPKVKLFITHGGLLSTSESIYYGKPVIGIPVFGDQTLNMKRAVNAGYGVHIDYKNVTESSITWALDTVLSSNK